MPEMKGGCLCGQVRYSATAEPIFVGICHCTSCQKESGSSFNLAVAVPRAALAIQGSPKTYSKRGDSGKEVVSRFCPNCGSTILSEAELLPEAAILRAGTLDDTSWLKPTMEIYCDSAQAWVDLAGGMARFPKMPMPG
jgi:hypothetical protein